MLDVVFNSAQMAIYQFQAQTFLFIGLVISLCIGFPVLLTRPWRD